MKTVRARTMTGWGADREIDLVFPACEVMGGATEGRRVIGDAGLEEPARGSRVGSGPVNPRLPVVGGGRQTDGRRTDARASGIRGRGVGLGEAQLGVAKPSSSWPSGARRVRGGARGAGRDGGPRPCRASRAAIRSGVVAIGPAARFRVPARYARDPCTSNQRSRSPHLGQRETSIWNTCLNSQLQQ